MENVRELEDNVFFARTSLQEKIHFLLRYAILAPSTHNTQPWKFAVRANSCSFFLDSSLRLPQADPKGRDAYISMGCCIENFILAASYFGMHCQIRYFPEGETGPVAEVTLDEKFHEKKVPDPSFKNAVRTIVRRVNARGIFEKKMIPRLILDAIRSNIAAYLQEGLRLDCLQEPEKITSVAALTAKGLQAAYRRPIFRKEMSQWMHHSLTQRRDGLPGYSLAMPFALSFLIPTLVRFFNIGALLGKLNYRSLASAPMVCVISANEENPLAWLKVGRLAQRLMIELNAGGISTSIFVASIEMGFSREIQNLLETKARPQFLFAAGFMKRPQKPSPRHALEDKLVLSL